MAVSNIFLSRVLAAVLLLFVLTLDVKASTIFDSGFTIFSPTGTQFGRISRDGTPSDWSGPKAFPGVIGAPALRAYESFTVNSGAFPFLQIMLDDPAAVFFMAAYLGAFNPVSVAPNYGLNVNYLGDPGLTQPFGNPSFFQIVVAPFTNVVIPINEIDPGGGTGASFRLIVEGFYDTEYNDTPVPEPSSIVLLGSGVALLTAFCWKRRSMTTIRTRVLRGGLAVILLTLPSVSAYAQEAISPEALQQIGELLQEKETRTGTQQKLGSKLIYALKESRGQQLTPNIDVLPSVDSLDTGPGGVLVDIHAPISTSLLSAVGQLGGIVIYVSASDEQIRARIPLDAVDTFAALPDVQSVRPAGRVKKLGIAAPARSRFIGTVGTMPIFQLLLGSALTHFGRLSVNLLMGSLTTQGDVTHTANSARSTYGVNGAGVKVGVLSDSAEATNFLIGTGDLPPNTTIVQEMIGGPGSSEGTAMMEIVSDLAPGAQLFFASAFNGPASFADNIRTLRNVYHCDIIVDDVSYSDESAFQDGLIARAVNDVTASGAIYFSSAGNGGNVTSGTSSTYESDFVNGGTNPLIPNHTLHNFLGGQTFNRLLTITGVVDLFWSDALGMSSNDYDLFVLNAAGTAVIAASTDVQNGSGDPFEEVFNPSGFPANSRVVIAAKTGAAVRALHLENFFGERLQISTPGATRGHNAGPSTVSVAAVAWNSARNGTRPFVGGASNPTEIFSSDGPRKMFYQADGSPITPGNFLFSTNGGTTFVKPDIAAADGVTVRTPSFNPFFGTSAAAPHAAGIAALIKSAKPSATVQEIYNAMISTALDIRAVGIDRDSGFGIVMARAAVAKVVQ